MPVTKLPLGESDLDDASQVVRALGEGVRVLDGLAGDDESLRQGADVARNLVLEDLQRAGDAVAEFGGAVVDEDLLPGQLLGLGRGAGAVGEPLGSRLGGTVLFDGPGGLVCDGVAGKLDTGFLVAVPVALHPRIFRVLCGVGRNIQTVRDRNQVRMLGQKGILS